MVIDDNAELRQFHEFKPSGRGFYSPRVGGRIKMPTVSEIKVVLQDVKDFADPLLEMYRQDERVSVQKLVASCEKRLKVQQQQLEKYQEMCRYENHYKAQGYQLIAGIDEAGRGPLSGPVVAGAVILSEGFLLPGLNDSKQLSEQRREEFFAYIEQHALAYSVGIVSAEEIDQINIYEATKLAMFRAIQGLKVQPDFLLIDAMKLQTEMPGLSLIKGDTLSISIAAASVVAKVTRDRMMKEYALKYPEYGFEKHMGYGTKEHLAAIQQFGPTPIHRMTFAPMQNIK